MFTGIILAAMAGTIATAIITAMAGATIGPLVAGFPLKNMARCRFPLCQRRFGRIMDILTIPTMDITVQIITYNRGSRSERHHFAFYPAPYPPRCC